MHEIRLQEHTHTHAHGWVRGGGNGDTKEDMPSNKAPQEADPHSFLPCGVVVRRVVQ